MTSAQQIQAACEKFNALSADADRTKDQQGSATPEQISSRNAARAELMTLLTGLGFVDAYETADGRALTGTAVAFASKRIGHVKITSGFGGLAASATFTPRATVTTAAKKNAIRARVASDERNY